MQYDLVSQTGFVSHPSVKRTCFQHAAHLHFRSMWNMRALHAAKFILLLAFTVPVFAEDLMAEALADCHKNQLTENFCAKHKFDIADQELNLTYKQQLARLSDPTTKERFKSAQRSWLAFRDGDCLYRAGRMEESGSIWPLEHWGCMEYQTQRRVEDMKSYLACTWNGCPQ